MGRGVYVARAGEARAPLTLVVQGSPCHPLFRTTGAGEKQRLQTTLPAGIEELVHTSKRALHFAVVERPGLRSFDGGDARNEPRRCTEERGGVTKNGRVRDLVDAALALGDEPWVSGIVLAGHSEGADVVAGAARLLGAARVLAVGLFAGGGPTQFYDFLIGARHGTDAGAAQRVFDDLLRFDSFTEATGEYRGHPATRMTSYGIESTILDDLSAVNVPVFVAQGTADTHVPVESADLLALELLRRRPLRAVRYVMGEGLDHGLCESNGWDHSGALFDDFLTWALGPDHPRSATTWTPPKHTIVVRYLGVRDVVWAGIAAAVAAAAGLIASIRRWRSRSRPA